ncbi:AbrB family transcriptional regulator [Gloeobacter morelensis]|uniref:AbrB family transcriptional regulator n=1 Tax=Gloeobacter morelensis MG652769 TaxID=2781736 RepID=A0ABY3PNT4_9CYAN|nr:AbrB family transcriptional regulator [Gloeobacter morelensis]UFP95275.1 AbrB family transcriptional regulator [Gloeobacter morelensis MG652769]
MTPVSGKELLKLIKQNPGKSAKQLAEMAGYTTVTKTGQKRVKMLAFQSAVLEANNIAIKPEQEEVETVRGGRKASYRIQVQQNGNLLIGSAYTRQMGLIPGTEFEIQIGRKHIKLVQVGMPGSGEDYGEAAESKELMAV